MTEAQYNPDTATSEAAPPANDSLLLKLEGFEGPLDLLLELARAQKVDLAKKHGADDGFVYPTGALTRDQQKEFSEQIKQHTGGAGADVLYAPGLATKEDIEDLRRQTATLTQTTEGIKARISIDLWSRQQRWDVQKSALLDTLKELASSEALLFAAVWAFQVTKGNESPEAKEQRKDANAEQHQQQGGNDIQPERAEHEQKLEMSPPIPPRPQVRSTIAAICPR